jgi:hypothetical protein
VLASAGSLARTLGLAYMPLREHVFARFRPVATGALRLDPESADAFASHLANANEGIHVVSQLCTGPNALKSETLDAILERWFRLLPEYDSPRRALAAKPGPETSLPALEASRAVLLHSRVLEVCLSQRRCTESDALAIATHLGRAAAPFWILAQHSASTERRSQRDLCALLRAVLSQPLQHALEAAHLYLAFGEA